MTEFLKYAIREKYAELRHCDDPAATRREIARLWRRLRKCK